MLLLSSVEGRVLRRNGACRMIHGNATQWVSKRSPYKRQHKDSASYVFWVARTSFSLRVQSAKH